MPALIFIFIFIFILVFIFFFVFIFFVFISVGVLVLIGILVLCAGTCIFAFLFSFGGFFFSVRRLFSFVFGGLFLVAFRLVLYYSNHHLHCFFLGTSLLGSRAAGTAARIMARASNRARYFFTFSTLLCIFLPIYSPGEDKTGVFEKEFSPSKPEYFCSDCACAGKGCRHVRCHHRRGGPAGATLARFIGRDMKATCPRPPRPGEALCRGI